MKKEKKNHVMVAVVTTSGSWPAEGFLSVPENQKVKNQLKEAIHNLYLVSTENWLAVVSGAEIDIDKSYKELNLSGTISIDFGPNEGGGGKNE